jgi:superfamily II DNA or RNA helicase
VTEGLGNYRYRQGEVLEKIWNSDSGIVHCVTGFGKTELIARVCMSYPQFRIAVVCPGRSELQTNMDRLAAAGVEYGQVDGRRKQLDKRVLVVTSASMQALEERGLLSQLRLVLFDEVHRAPAKQVRQALARVHNGRLFGFTATIEGRSDNGEKVIEGLFGPTIAQINYAEAEDNGLVVPINVCMMHTDGPSVQGYKQEASKSRYAVWRNNDRNERFASIAQQLEPMGQVLILCDTLEHALNLRRHLPGTWPLVYGTDPYQQYRQAMNRHSREGHGQLDKLPKDAERAQRAITLMEEQGLTTLTDAQRSDLHDRFASGEITGAVATRVWAQAVDFPNLQFVIRADGMGSPILSTQGGGRASRVAGNKQVGIVIDAEDNFDKSMVRRRQKRVRTYKDLGWTIQRKLQPYEIPEVCRQILSQGRDLSTASG